MVLHTVAPLLAASGAPNERLLRQCYDAALLAAEKEGLASLALCALGTGFYGFPEAAAATIAVDSAVKFDLAAGAARSLQHVVFSTWGEQQHEVYERVLAQVSGVAGRPEDEPQPRPSVPAVDNGALVNVVVDATSRCDDAGWCEADPFDLSPADGRLVAETFAEPLPIDKALACMRGMRVTDSLPLTTDIGAADEEHSPLFALTLGGSFNPVHAGHLACLEAARARMEDAGHEVVAGWLVPCSLPWMFSKMQSAGLAQYALPSVARVAICEAAVADSDWISVCPVEAAAGNYASVDGSPVAALSIALAQHTSRPIVFMRLAGIEGKNVVVRENTIMVIRPDDMDAPDAPVEEPAKHFYVAPNLVPGSSTKLRKAILAKDDTTVQAAVPLHMAAFLRAMGGLWGYHPSAEHAGEHHTAAPEPEPEAAAVALGETN
jgi:hypothetical protein